MRAVSVFGQFLFGIPLALAIAVRPINYQSTSFFRASISVRRRSPILHPDENRCQCDSSAQITDLPLGDQLDWDHARHRV